MGLTKAAAREVAEKGITVNGFPGIYGSGITNRLPEKLKKKLIQEIPAVNWVMLKGAKMVVHLASEEAEYITGQSIFISGGAICKWTCN